MSRKCLKRIFQILMLLGCALSSVHAANRADLVAASTPVGGDWYYSDWFGYFQISDSPSAAVGYIFHNEHGSLWIYDGDDAGFWYHDSQSDEVVYFTDYPHISVSGVGLDYFVGSAPNRKYYHNATGSIEFRPIDLPATPDGPNGPLPKWWKDHGAVDLSVPVQHFAPLNTGQILNIARAGIEELDNLLAPIGGAGFTLGAIRDPRLQPAYYAPALTGQLKFISSKFYLRFSEIGFTPGSAGWPAGLLLDAGGGDSSPGFPWLQDQTSDNASIALIGQAKYLFSWDVRPWVSQDIDSNNLPDYWEQYWFLSLGAGAMSDTDNDGLSNLDELFFGTSPVLRDTDGDGFGDGLEVVSSADALDRFNGLLPELEVLSGDAQHGAPNEILPIPLSVRVSNDGQPSGNALVVFSLETPGLLGSMPGGSFVGNWSVSVLTDTDGIGTVWLKLPDSFGVTARVIASVRTTGPGGIGELTQQVVFTAGVDLALPYLTGFESSEGFSVGSLDAQQGWLGTTGAQIVSTIAKAGAQSLEVGPGSNQAHFSVGGDGVGTLILESSVYLTADGVFNPSDNTLPPVAATLVSYDPTQGIMAYDGNGSGGGSWALMAGTLLNNQWVDIKIVAHYVPSTPASQYWELWVNGALKHGSLGFRDNSVTAPSHVTFENHKISPMHVDVVSLSD